MGDSRTAGIQATLKKQMSSSVTNGVSFVANPGKGLSWFRDTGYAQLIEEIDKTEGSKPIAVIFNLGVNDLGNAGNYVSYMTSIASTLKSKRRNKKRRRNEIRTFLLRFLHAFLPGNHILRLE